MQQKPMQRQHKRRYVAACAISDAIYRDNTDDTMPIQFFPDAPPAPPMAPVKPRATPYTELPAQCFIEPQRGTIRCFSTESRGGLYPRAFLGQVVGPAPNQSYGPGYTAPSYPGPSYGPEYGASGRSPVMINSGRVAPIVPVDNFNYVYGQEVVAQPYDSPLNRILTRQPTGPWRLVGAAVLDHGHEDVPPKIRTMMVYCQTVDSARDRYHYRVVDNNNVPLDLDGGERVRWKSDGERLHIPGYPPHYKLHLYNTYMD